VTRVPSATLAPPLLSALPIEWRVGSAGKHLARHRVPGVTGFMRRLSILLSSCLVAGAAAAAPLSPPARAEIDALLSKLEASGCDFNRNGTWYTGTEAKPHLLRKLRYLEDRGMVQSAEQFVELAASSSSISGQPYLVRCGNSAPVQSAKWLLSQLQAMRSTGGRAKGAP
jgi:Family of unknown function (DUF5329)